MTTNFNVTALTGHQYLVEGTDSVGKTGSVVLDGARFDEITTRKRAMEAHEVFDSKVEDFFSDLTTAARELEAAHEPDGLDKNDPLSSIVLTKGVEAVTGTPEVRVELDPDTAVLAALVGYASGSMSERLRWVKGGEALVITRAVSLTPEQREEQTVRNVMDSIAEGLGLDAKDFDIVRFDDVDSLVDSIREDVAADLDKQVGDTGKAAVARAEEAAYAEDAEREGTSEGDTEGDTEDPRV